ncbi:MAG: hypothetical protein MJZ26_03915 [Fibrobacter sp.]|nr:hypothetical protein [Fibrobacter sp.]
MKKSIKYVAAALMLAATAFAQDKDVYIRNVCDTLPESKKPEVKLALAYVEETTWTTDYKYENEKDKQTTRKKSLDEVVPLRKKFEYGLPVSVTASCSETENNIYEELNWNGSQWDAVYKNYATVIMDIHGNTVGQFNEENTNNLLLMSLGTLPENNSYKAYEILPSKSYEFQFEWWAVNIVYRTETITKTENPDGSSKTEVHNAYSTKSSLGNDYESVMKIAKLSSVASSVTDVSFQVLHGVMMDSTKIKPEELFSSSSEATSSSSEEIASSSSVESSSSVSSSSSSSEVATGIVRLDKRPVQNARSEMRRLDGTSVKNNEKVVPGVYYVKGADGLWKKQMVLPR